LVWFLFWVGKITALKLNQFRNIKIEANDSKINITIIGNIENLNINRCNNASFICSFVTYRVYDVFFFFFIQYHSLIFICFRGKNIPI